MQSSTICFIFTFWSLIYKRDILRGWGGREEVFKVLEGTHRNSHWRWLKMQFHSLSETQNEEIFVCKDIFPGFQGSRKNNPKRGPMS